MARTAPAAETGSSVVTPGRRAPARTGGTIRLRLAFGDGLYSLRGEAAHAGAAPTEVDRAGAIGDAGAIHLRASGGRGGRGGDGGTGGTGGYRHRRG
jgi:hypothetical protein